MKEIEWKSVPGYSNYQLNIATLSVRNLSTNKNLVLRKGMVQLIGENGNICINMPRLLFCVSKGIPPRLVPRNIIIVIENGYPVAYDRSEYMSEKIKSVYHERANQDPLESYMNARDFIDNVISSMESKDYTTVAKRLYGYRKQLIGRIIKNGVMRNEDEAVELASAAIERTISNIISGVLVFFPFQYMYGVAKGISADIHRAEKKAGILLDLILITNHMRKEMLYSLFGIEDLKDLSVAVMNLIEGDIDARNDVYRELIRLNNNDMSYDWFQEIYEEELSERKQKKQDFTPNSLGVLCSMLTSQSGSIHEPTAGNGSMIIADWWQRCKQNMPWEHFPSQNIVTCWELSARSIPILLLNLSIRGIMGYVYHGDVLEKSVKMKYILLNRKDDTLGFSDIIKDPGNKLTIKKEIHYDDSRDIR